MIPYLTEDYFNPSSMYEAARGAAQAIARAREVVADSLGGVDPSEDTLVYCRLAGACAGCPGAAQTLRMMVEGTLKDNVEQRIRVIQV